MTRTSESQDKNFLIKRASDYQLVDEPTTLFAHKARFDFDFLTRNDLPT